MARNASMSPAECEAMLGQRGALTVNVDNRHLVRKWLVARGVPSSHVGTLAMAALQGAYNDTTDGAYLAICGAASSVEDNEQPAPKETPQAPVATPAAPQGDETAAALQALRALLGSGAAIDESRVRQIMRDELPDLIPVTRIEITTPEGIKHHGPAPRHKQLPDLIRALSCGIPVALVGPAGSGKTTAAEQAAEILGHTFYIQGAVQGAHELLGFVDAQGRYQSTPFRQAFEHGGTICLDELDAGDPAGILVCNSALANCFMPFPDQTAPVKKHENFNLVACLNTFGNGADRIYVGRNQLDGATLDRFCFLNWRYDETLERAIAGNDSWCDRVQALRRGSEKEKARVVISPRASIYGAKLLNAGAKLADVELQLVWKGVDSELRRRIETSAA